MVVAGGESHAARTAGSEISHDSRRRMSRDGSGLSSDIVCVAPSWVEDVTFRSHKNADLESRSRDRYNHIRYDGGTDVTAADREWQPRVQ